MLDKVTINITDPSLISSIIDIIGTSDKTTQLRETPSGFKANFANLLIIGRQKSLTITGSITKLGLGVNSINADKAQNKKHIQDFAEELGLPLSTPVRDLEFGFNLAMPCSANVYLEAMEKASGYLDVYTHSNKAKYFQKSNIHLRFYNKDDHFSNSLPVTAHIPSNLNILRYEIRLLKQDVSAENPTYTLASLQLNSVQDELIALWAREFNKVIFRPLSIPVTPLSSPKALFNHLILKGVEAYGGLNNVLAIVNSQKPKNYVFTNRAKTKLTQLYRSADLSTISSLGNDLAKKVVLAACFYRAQNTTDNKRP